MASPFESPTHRQKRITFELSVFFVLYPGRKFHQRCVAMTIGYACKPAAYRHIPTSLKRAHKFSSTPNRIGSMALPFESPIFPIIHIIPIAPI